MLLSFSVSNFRSFRDEQMLDLQASSLQPAFSWLEHAAVGVGKGESALRVKALYGANASGKSNMIEALMVGVNLVRDSALNENLLAAVKPFSFDGEYLAKPSIFRFEFAVAGRRFRYGFSCDVEKIHEEWLYDNSIRKRKIFKRTEQNISVSNAYFERVDAVALLKSPDNRVFRPNSLFLSALHTFDVGGIAQHAINFFQRILVLKDVEQQNIKEFANKLLFGEEMRAKVKELLKFASIDIDHLVVIDKENFSLPDMPPGFMDVIKASTNRFPLLSVYKIENADQPQGTWLSEHYESQGTQKMLVLAPLVVQAILRGWVIIIDEFEAKLHTKLSREIIQLFNSKVGNPNNAQFIFSTHDTNLLDKKLLRRDQIDFVEKGSDRASRLFSLADIKGTRKEDDLEQDYLGGRYGAVPEVTDFNIAILED